MPLEVTGLETLCGLVGRLSLELSKECVVCKSGRELAFDVRGTAVLSDSVQLDAKAVGLAVRSPGDTGDCAATGADGSLSFVVSIVIVGLQGNYQHSVLFLYVV